jgi:hypothetical protein
VPLNEGNLFSIPLLEIDSWKSGVLRADYIISIANEHPFINVEVVYEVGPFVILQNRDPEYLYVAAE